MITDKSKLLFESGADVSQQYCQQSRWQSTRLQQILLIFIFLMACYSSLSSEILISRRKENKGIFNPVRGTDAYSSEEVLRKLKCYNASYSTREDNFRTYTCTHP